MPCVKPIDIPQPIRANRFDELSCHFVWFFNGATSRVRKSVPRVEFTPGAAYLDESNVGGLFTEALTADVQAVLADQTSLVCADSAVVKLSVEAQRISSMSSGSSSCPKTPFHRTARGVPLP
jgi:Zn-dependent M28 family amino/carboxypeptidase